MTKRIYSSNNFLMFLLLPTQQLLVQNWKNQEKLWFSLWTAELMGKLIQCARALNVNQDSDGFMEICCPFTTFSADHTTASHPSHSHDQLGCNAFPWMMVSAAHFGGRSWGFVVMIPFVLFTTLFATAYWNSMKNIFKRESAFPHSVIRRKANKKKDKHYQDAWNMPAHCLYSQQPSQGDRPSKILSQQWGG